MLLRLDEKLLSTAQKFCDNMQKTIGLTKFFFEKWSVIGIVAALTMNAFFWNNWFFSAIDGIVIFLATFSIFEIEKRETEFFRNGTLLFSKWVDAPKRVEDVISDIFLILINLTSAIIIGPPACLMGIAILFSIAWKYFSVCVPRPPGKSKLREWLDDLAQERDLVPATE